MKTTHDQPRSEPTAGKDAPTEAMQDHDLVERFKAHDEAAFTAIVQRHYARIRALAQRILHDESDAEEIAQDTFIRAHRALPNFRGDCTLHAWLYRIGLNLARNRYWYYCRRHRHDTLSLNRAPDADSSLTLVGLLSDGSVGPRTESIKNEFVTLVADCMDCLAESHREILAMRTILNLSYGEIARQLAVNTGTVKSRLARAREQLRKLVLERAPEFSRESSLISFFEPDRSQLRPYLASV